MKPFFSVGLFSACTSEAARRKSSKLRGRFASGTGLGKGPKLQTSSLSSADLGVFVVFSEDVACPRKALILDRRRTKVLGRQRRAFPRPGLLTRTT